ncbi:MAG: GYD domain-containing protein [Methanomicrobiaceae archaeon]|nr:GYD domain-containing protein [Methanomicrobiaceae archaeon]
MTLYIVLGKLTDIAIAKMKEAKERDDKAKQTIQSAGGKLIGLYYTLGRYDFVAIVEMPSPEALANVIINITQWGTLSTESMTALLPDQMYKMAP